jgi:hypothetical protein
MSASATAAYFYIHGGGSATGTVYYSQPMLVFGSSIGEGNYTRPQGEVIYFEARRVGNTYNSTTGHSDVGATTLNLEADSNGAIPKGAKAVELYARIKDSGSAASETYGYIDGGSGAHYFINEITGLTNDVNHALTGWSKCDANGDVRASLEASGSGTMDVTAWQYQAVELH